MDKRLSVVMREFSALSNEARKKRLISWVKKGTFSIIPILKKISSDDPDVQIRYLARKGIYHLNQRFEEKQYQFTEATSLEVLLQEFDSGVHSRISAVSDYCVFYSKQEVLPFLRDYLSGIEDPFILSTCIVLLGKIGQEEDYVLIEDCSNNEDSRVRASVLEALSSLDPDRCLPYLLKAIGDEDNRIRAVALQCLRFRNKAVVFQSLEEMSKSPHVWMRSSAAYALGEYKSNEPLSYLLSLLQDENEVVKKMAYKSLNRMAANGNTRAQEILKKSSELSEEESISDFFQLMESKVSKEENLLNSEDSRKRLIEINKITQERIKDRYQELERRLLIEDDNYVIASLILALGYVKKESSIELIQAYLNSNIPRLRANAIESLSHFCEPRYLSKILLNLEDTNNRARANAVLALRDFIYVDKYRVLLDMIESDQILMQQSAFYAITELAHEDYYSLFECLLQRVEDPKILSNINDFLKMKQDESEICKSLIVEPKQEEGSREKFDALVELETQAMEQGLDSSDYVHEDFDGFTPDDLEEKSFESIKLEDFLNANAETKVQMIEFMKMNQGQSHFDVLKYAEKDKDFQVKCLAKMAMKLYSADDYADSQVSDIVVRKDGSVQVVDKSFLAEIGLKIKKVDYDGGEQIDYLNQDLIKREEGFKKSGIWRGQFNDQLAMLNAMRLDTQQMIQQILGSDRTEVLSVTLAYYSPSYKAYREGKKSLDMLQHENFIQLNTFKTQVVSQVELSPTDRMICSCASPKYMLLIQRKDKLILFLRQLLQFQTADYVEIPIDWIKDLQASEQGSRHHIDLVLKDGISLRIPNINAIDSQTISKIHTEITKA
ncbi:MAG: HEAT repeat domain-containing protein [Candidatus Cloacimonetes bacterium]|nr:HEAT repeat domain-containing protein [Candidatus Cloacimonadota bacterium]